MTMADIICPICNRVNDSSAERCWYCQAILVKDQPTGSENEAGKFSGVEQAGTANHSGPASDNQEEEIPEWLARIRQLEREEREQSQGVNPFTSAESPADENADWLNGFRLEGESVSESDTQEPEKEVPPLSEPEFLTCENPPERISAKEDEEVYDAFESLLAELGIGPSNQLEEVVEPEAGGEPVAEDLEQVESDFLKRLDFTERHESEKPSDQSNLDSVSSEEIADVLKKIDSTHGYMREEETTIPSQELPESNLEPETAVDFEPISQPKPGIERNQESEFDAENEPEPIAGMESASGEQSKELPTLESSGIIPPVTDTPRPISFDDDDLPEWLSLEEPVSAKKSDEPKNKPTPAVGQDLGKLERAHLPAWLHAIRPVEAVTPLQPAPEPPAEGEKPAEQGILSGIEGVLRSADLTGQIKKPPVYSPGIEVSERQLQNVALFKTLLEGAEPVDLAKSAQKPPVKSSLILRIVVTLALLAAVLMPIFSYTPFVITPVLFPAEVVNTFSKIQNLPSDKPVLLAAHFEAGLAGEMKWTSRAVIEHLMARNIPMTLISTNAIGYAILEEEIRGISSVETNYSVDDQVVNLGYLPGGTLGILSLTRNLHQALPYTTTIQPAWDQPILLGINRLSDFGAVIILTDNADIVKTWVEQVGTSADVSPILAVLSAQAAPMTQPYYDSGQIKGFVAGMNGSQSYEQIMQRPYQSTLAFGSFQSTLLITALIIFIGGAVSLILSSGAGMKKGAGK